MIIELDHTTLLVRNLDMAVEHYRQILAREPDSRATSEGLEYAIFRLGNAAFRIAAPKGTGPRGKVASAQLDERGEGLFDVVFRVEDVARAYRSLRRLSLSPDEPSDATEIQNGKRTALPQHVSAGIPISFCDGGRHLAAEHSESGIAGIDLLVVATAKPERAMGFYGARLGLSLIFDQVNSANGSRLMQFQCGDMLIEVIHRPGEDKDDRADRLWGIGWRVLNAEAVRERLARAGINVSDVKDGAKRGTRVFTIRNSTCNVPALVVQHIGGSS